MPESPIRVVLADDHQVVLEGLRQLFRNHGDFEVVACCRTGDEALAAVRKGGVDVLVMDLRMPERSGLDVLRTLSTEPHAHQTVLLAATIGDDDAVEAIRLGVRGLVMKESTSAELLDCVRRVHNGEQRIDQPTMSRAFQRVSRRELATVEIGRVLSAREIEVLRLLALGLKNRDIGSRLCIAEGTVKIHIHNIYDKLGIEGRLELLLYAREKGLV